MFWTGLEPGLPGNQHQRHIIVMSHPVRQGKRNEERGKDPHIFNFQSPMSLLIWWFLTGVLLILWQVKKQLRFQLQ